MRVFGNRVRLALILISLLAVPRLWAQGPPYQTDDPVPVDFQHYEFYIFGITDSTPVVATSGGPAFEFNWGAVPRVQIHAVLPFGESAPMNSAVYDPSGQGPSAYGLGDMEVGVKIAFIKESKHVPQIGSFTMFELPTGSYTKGLGIGKVWYKLPIWVQKNEGKWLFDGGAGYEVVPQTDYKNFVYGGFLVKKELSERLELGAEIFAHGAEDFDKLHRRGSDRDDPDRGKNTEHERKHHLHAGLGGRFFRPLAALGAHGVRMHAQRLRDARPELVGLHEHCHERRDVVDAGSIREVVQRLAARFASAQLEVDQAELVA